MADVSKLPTPIEELVKEWAQERNIIPSDEVLEELDEDTALKILTTQSMKLSSELSEYYEAKYKGDKAAIDDAIGDMLVVCNSLNIVFGLHFAQMLNIDTEKEWNKRITGMTNSVSLSIAIGYLQDYIIKRDADNIFKWLVIFEKTLAELELYDSETGRYSYEKYLNIAYSEIKDRKGKTLPNGNFVKEVK